MNDPPNHATAGAEIARSLTDAAVAVRSGETTAAALVTEALERVERHEGELGAFVHVDRAGALAQADALDEAIRAGDPVGPLAGVPFGVKDLDDCLGMPTSYGSRLFLDGGPADREPPYLRRLRRAGAIPIGKTATPEFGRSAATWSDAWGVTRNPWHPERTPGGSSGGSAAAVAAGIVPFATGTDAGGSIRSPAAFCGLVGLKPSFGLIPGDGRVGVGQPGDFHGWGFLTATVSDTAALLDVAAGPHPLDRASLGHRPPCFADAIETLEVGGLRAAWSPDFGYAAIEQEVGTCAHEAAQTLAAAAGLVLEDVALELPDLRLVAVPRLVELRAVLAAAGLYPGRVGELGSQVREDLELRGGVAPAVLGEAIAARGALQRTVAALFEEVDVLLTPATACVAFDATASDVATIDGGPSTGAEPLSVLANACWLPAASVPRGPLARGPADRAPDRRSVGPRRPRAAAGPAARGGAAVAAHGARLRLRPDRQAASIITATKLDVPRRDVTLADRYELPCRLYSDPRQPLVGRSRAGLPTIAGFRSPHLVGS